MIPLPDRLRRETQPLHQQTETIFYADALRNGALTLVQYRHLLRTHLTFHQALETAIDTYPDFFRDYEPQNHRKTPWLLTDLANLANLDEPLPPPMPDLFANWSTTDLLGALYVSEGSMLGGTVISRLLQQHKALHSILPVASRFYQGYGADTGRYWRSSSEFISQRGNAHADAVVAAASEAFRRYQQAFLRSQNPATQA